MIEQVSGSHPIQSPLPADVEGYDALAELALDLRWTWNHATDKVWRQLDPVLWDLTHHPCDVLQTVSREKIRALLADQAFRKQADALVQSKKQAEEAPAWFQQRHPGAALRCVAYFSMEFMLSEALPIYSGGLGNVAGDQLKAASDLGVPVVGVGLLTGNLFTTHTAVAAGFDRFAPALIAQYLAGYAGKIGLALDDLLALGRQNPRDPPESFNMAYLAIRGSGAVNGVSRPHGLEPPTYRGFGAVHGESADVFQAMRPLQPGDVVRGQYAGYRKEPGVAKDSDVETFCALRLHIDSWRWGGVPWYLRSGKHLAEKAAEVLVQLKAPPQQLFADSAPGVGAANYLRFRLSPNSATALAARAKRAGKDFVGDRRELFLLDERPGEEAPYERLLADAMAGNGALFTREDAVEAAWAVVDPVLGEHHRAMPYERGGWGPTEADALIAPDGAWHNPMPGRAQS